MSRLLLVHWNGEEAKANARTLKELGHTTDILCDGEMPNLGRSRESCHAPCVNAPARSARALDPLPAGPEIVTDARHANVAVLCVRSPAATARALPPLPKAQPARTASRIAWAGRSSTVATDVT